MRRRLAALIEQTDDLHELGSVVRRELGIDVTFGYAGVRWTDFLTDCALKDLLDLITLAFRELTRQNQKRRMPSATPRVWLNAVRRTFAKENIGFTVDSHGGVHFRIDEEFARNRAAALACLENPRYANALHSFEEAMVALAEVPPNGK